MKKLFAAFCLISLTTSNCLAADYSQSQTNQMLQPRQSQPSLNKQNQSESSGPTSEYYPEAVGVGEPTGEGAQHQSAPNQQTQSMPPVTSSQLLNLKPQFTFYAATTNAPSAPQPIPELPPAVSTPATPSVPPATSVPTAAPAMPAAPAPPVAKPDHSDAPAATQLPAGAQTPAPPNPDVTKMKVSAQKNLDSEGHSIGSQVRACWKIPKSSIGGAPLTAVIYIDKQGALTFSEFTTTPTDKQSELADSIKTAVTQCNPLKSLPPEAKYDEWKSILIKFNPNRKAKK